MKKIREEWKKMGKKGQLTSRVSLKDPVREEG